MTKVNPTDAEKAMKANAGSRVQQGADSDAERHDALSHKSGTADPPPGADLQGPRGDPAEGKR